MKTLLCLLSLLIPTLTLAEKKETPATPTGEAATIKKKNCPLCKLPGRAALFAGAVRPCPADCPKLCCKGTELVLLLEGLADQDGTGQVTAALSGLKDVRVKGVRTESGRTILNYNATQLTAAQVRGTLERAGFKIAGELCTFKITGLRKPGATDVLVEALASTAGVSAIDTVCQDTGQAIIEYDPAETTPQRLAAAIHATPCKVIP